MKQFKEILTKYGCYSDELLAEISSLLLISEYDKIDMSSTWSRERSEGDRTQDRDCYYDFYHGIEAAVKKIYDL